MEIEQIEEQENLKIKQLIQTTQLAPHKPGEDPFSDIVVVSFQDVPTPTAEVPSLSDKATTWLGQHWTAIGMMVLGLISLVVLREMLNMSPRNPGSPAETAAVLSATSRDDSNSEPTGAPRGGSTGPKRQNKTGNDLQDELVGMVQNDPDSAAAILRGWLSEAS